MLPARSPGPALCARAICALRDPSKEAGATEICPRPQLRGRRYRQRPRRIGRLDARFDRLGEEIRHPAVKDGNHGDNVSPSPAYRVGDPIHGDRLDLTGTS